jgi:hypothetical protein
MATVDIWLLFHYGGENYEVLKIATSKEAVASFSSVVVYSAEA